MLVRHLLAGVLLVAFSLTPMSARAAQSYDNCTGFIDSLPAVITTPGTWCLRKDLSTAMAVGKAIDVQANNITIDCNDFKLGGLAAGPGTDAAGISSQGVNTTVRRCNVRGFRIGVGIGSGGLGHVVEDNRFDGNTSKAIVVHGDSSVVRRNHVLTTGGSSIAPELFAIGIYAIGDVDILDNTISGVIPSTVDPNYGTAYGIFTSTNGGGSISGNRVRGLVSVGDGLVSAIYNYDNGRIIMRGNTVVGTGSESGFYCQNATAHAKDNVILGFDNALINCIDQGNVTTP